MTFREYFDRVEIINLAERADRRAEMTAELERGGMPIEPGRVEFFPAVRPRDAAGFDNPGYHGCFRSHLEIFRRAAAAGVRHLLVVEDDAALSPRFHEDEAAVVEQLRTRPWGVVLLGHGGEPPANRPVELRPYDVPVAQSHFYAVHADYLGRLLAFFESVLTRPPGDPDGGPMSPDAAINFFLGRNPDVPALVAWPSLAGQRSSRSDISPRWFDRVPGLKQTAALVRRMRRRK